jgi:GT2 family glycosyltransferase
MNPKLRSIMEVQISIVIVTYNSSRDIKRAIESIYNFINGICFEVIVIDNNSNDNTLSVINSLGLDIVLIRNTVNVGFAKANNQGFRLASGKFILIFNPDLALTENTRITDLLSKLSFDLEIGLIAPKLYFDNGVIQESARGFPNPIAQLIRLLKMDRLFKSNKFYKKYLINLANFNDDHYVDWVIGAFMLIRREVLFEVGLFDERYQMYMEDADLCMQLRNKGYKICYSSRFSALHSYKRESSKSIFSKLKWIHILSSLKFYAKYSYKLFS